MSPVFIALKKITEDKKFESNCFNFVSLFPILKQIGYNISIYTPLSHYADNEITVL